MSKRPRKPATILRQLRRVSMLAAGPLLRHELLALTRELSRAIATSGKAPGRR